MAPSSMGEDLALSRLGAEFESLWGHVDYENTLKWIRHIAAAHYWGGAFDPEHMRDIANVAANALDGKVLPDYDEMWAEAQRKAQALAEKYAKDFIDGE